MKKIINTPQAPAPIGPYNQATLIGDFLYTSGQIAMDVTTGELKTNDIEAETELVMQHLKAILSEAEMSFDQVIKVSIFISDMNNFAKINQVYAKYFSEANAPARETVEVACLPKNVNVEISLIAHKQA
ncbi:MAG: Rid family detoxifying hydrolase [Flavobacteriaceae bacterium]|nr:Rid family detoxifying hydrolase [Flavobacteriaceae bacterium]